MNSKKERGLWAFYLMELSEKLEKDFSKNLLINVPNNFDIIRAVHYDDYLQLMETRGWIGTFDCYLIKKKIKLKHNLEVIFYSV